MDHTINYDQDGDNQGSINMKGAGNINGTATGYINISALTKNLNMMEHEMDFYDNKTDGNAKINASIYGVIE